MKIVAFCGFPKAGKDHAARILAEAGFVHYDDKRVLRDMARAAFMLDPWQVDTQEGKASEITIAGVRTSVRQAMGDLGSHFESAYGEGFFAWRALKELSGTPVPRVITSARLSQPRIYREAGALVVELVRDGCGPLVSVDRYDSAAAHVRIVNTGEHDVFAASLFEAIGRLRPDLLSRHIDEQVES